MRPFLLALLLLAAPVASAQGVLVFDDARIDLGRIAEGAEPSVTFRFTNAGDAPLTLQSVEAACGCTTPSYSAGPVPPGAGGEVQVAYDSDGRPGPFEKAVYVVAGDAGAATLRITGVVEPALARTGERRGALAFDRVRADVGEVPAGEAAQTSFRFANTGAQPIRITRVVAPPGVEVALPDRPVFTDDIRGLFVTVEDPAPFAGPSGAFAVELTVYTTEPGQATTRLWVEGRIGRPRALPDGGE